MAGYRIGYEKADFLQDQLWMHAYGIASMIATDFCDWNKEKVSRMFADCKDTFVKEYKV